MPGIAPGKHEWKRTRMGAGPGQVRCLRCGVRAYHDGGSVWATLDTRPEMLGRRIERPDRRISGWAVAPCPGKAPGA